MASDIQTVIVSKRIAKTLTVAMAIAKRHAHRIYTSRETEDSFRFRQRPPSDFKEGTFRTRTAAPGVTVVYGELK